MAGPTQRAVNAFVVPPGEATVQFAPVSLAEKILNLELTTEGTLRSVNGPAPYEPSRDLDSSYRNQYGGYTGTASWSRNDSKLHLLSRQTTRVHGVFHATLLNGMAPTLLARSGKHLYRHLGWYRGWERLKMQDPDDSGESTIVLTNDKRPRFPDQFVVINDSVIWTNGIDRPLVIRHDGMVTPLGYERSPGAPIAEGPETAADLSKGYSNSANYSWPGRIGSIGDVVSTHEGALLSGEWWYQVAWEDIHGNMSPLSPRSSSVRVDYQVANENIGGFVAGARAAITNSGGVGISSKVDSPAIVLSTRVGQLPRQFVVRSTGDAPPHTVATWLYRTPDVKRQVARPHLVERIDGAAPFVYADNIPDSRLSLVADTVLPVPTIHTMTSHAGALVASNGQYVYISMPGMPGTFVHRLTPDPDGAVITALASHSGRLIAFTERAMIDITELDRAPTILAKGIGCDSPRSIQGMPNGSLIWHSRDGFYAWSPGSPVPQKISDPIHRIVQDELSLGSMRRAVSAVDPRTREYRIAVTPAGSSHNKLILTFDGRGWRELRVGFTVNDICQTDDARQMLLFAGKNTDTGVHDVYAFDREIQEYELPERTYTFRSSWLRADETGLQPVNVHTLYVGLVDEQDLDLDINVFSDGSYASDEDSPRPIRAIGTFKSDEPAANDLTGSAIIGTAKVHRRRLFWRKVTVGLENVRSWKFEITSTNQFHIAAFAIQSSIATSGDSLARIPFGDD